jgi:hypothetical protein
LARWGQPHDRGLRDPPQVGDEDVPICSSPVWIAAYFRRRRPVGLFSAFFWIQGPCVFIVTGCAASAE